MISRSQCVFLTKLYNEELIIFLQAEWHPSRDDMFVVGSMSQPRKIDVYDAASGKGFDVRGEQLASVCSIVKAHPTNNVVVGGNASGRVFVFAE